MADQEPGSALKEMRTSAFLPALKSKVMLAYLLHSSACSTTLCCWVLLPPRKATPSVRPSGHILPANSAIFALWLDAPGMSFGIFGMLRGFSRTACSIAWIL